MTYKFCRLMGSVSFIKGDGERNADDTVVFGNAMRSRMLNSSLSREHLCVFYSIQFRELDRRTHLRGRSTTVANDHIP